MLAIALVPIVIYRVARPRAASRTTPVWDGGILAFKPRMQYTATTHANPVRVVFQALYQPVIWTVQRLALLVRPLQIGDVNVYLLYVFVAVTVAYAIYAA